MKNLAAATPAVVREHRNLAGAVFLDGELVPAAAAGTVELTEPATGRHLMAAAKGDPTDIDLAVGAAQRALAGRWGKTAASARARLLFALAEAVDGERSRLAELESRNLGKAIAAVEIELRAASEMFRHFGSVAGTVEGRASSIGGSIEFYTLKRPVGVVGQILPWNYPFMLAALKLAPALAAGCTVVLKADQGTPVTSLRLAELISAVGFPDGVVNVVPGDGPTVGASLVSHPGVAKISFTGSTATGVEIGAAAARAMKRLTLELGGKSPSLVFADADLDAAVASSVWSIFNSAGQSCEARTRILVEAEAYDEFLARFVAAAEGIRVGDPLDRETQVGSLVSRSHRDRVHAIVERARAASASVALGGEIPAGEGAFYPPTVLTNVAWDAEVVREEVFGPVVTVQPVADEAEALKRANQSRYGLVATVWSGDAARGPRLARALDVGTVSINTPYTNFPGVPFGGRKDSGVGREGGLEALESHLETKSVVLGSSARPARPPWPAAALPG